ncbi:lipoxygenase 1, chloroplastic [Tanacetum coccineum]
MALAKELMGTSIFQEKQPSFTNSKALKPMHQNHVSISQNGSFRIRTKVVVKSAISEDIAKFVKNDKDSKKVSFKVRGVLTVRNKVQEDFKETLVKKIDAFADQIIGRNVVLELFSLDIDPTHILPESGLCRIKLLREKELRDFRRRPEQELRKDRYSAVKDPYPRRCRTGRAPSDTDISAESRVEKPFPLYVPRDEQFDESKQNTFSTSRLKAVLHNLLPSMVASISKKHDFKGFSQIESLYSEGVLLKLGLQDDLIKKLRLPNLVTRLHESSQGGGLLKYDTPKILSKDRFSWLRDDEFARQALAGVNPVSIEKLKVFPPVSQLDPEIYGRTLSLPSNVVLTPPVDALINWTWQLAKAGMAVPDPSQRHGLKLLIEDYPYASDGLLIWEAIQNWVQTYVTRYYPDPSLVCNDRELQAWYAEGLNTIGHQECVALIPDENDPEYASFLEDPQNYFLLALPSMLQSTKYMAVVDTLSTHSPDEEYIGERQQTRTQWMVM